MNPNTRHVIIEKIRFLFVAILVIFNLGQSSQTAMAAEPVYYVTDSAPSSGGGLSWDNPVALSTALQWAKEQPASRVVIRVAAGSYHPVGPDPSATFTIPENASLYGGFGFTPGSTTVTYDWKTNLTVLSGSIILPDLSPARSYHVVTFVDGTGEQSAILDGFIIQDGNANSTTSPADRNGGGILVNHTEPIMDHLIVRNNAASVKGGGIFVWQDNVSKAPHPVIQNSQILNNQANIGGGLAADGNNLELINSVFYGNAAQKTGGAMMVDSATNPTILTLKNVTIVKNTAQINSGVIAALGLSSSARLSNSIIWNNQPVNSAFATSLSLQCIYNLIHELNNECPDRFGNLDADPQFVYLPDGDQTADLRLKSFSPAVNAGAGTYTGSDKDLDGNPRAIGDQVDLGAFEAQNVNHAPTLAQTQITLDPVTQQTSSQIAIHDLVQRLGVNDADGVIGSAGGVAIIGNNSASGVWEYSLDNGGSWQVIGQMAFLLQDAPGTWLRFRVIGPSTGSASLQLRAWDGADQRANASSSVEISASGSATPYSAAVATVNVPGQVKIFLPLLSQINN